MAAKLSFPVDSCKSKTLQLQTSSPKQRIGSALAFASAPSAKILKHFESDLTLCALTHTHLDFDQLTCFEAVDTQFQQWGITFANAIAIQPSNPAYPIHNSQTVLMAAPTQGFMEAVFRHPVRLVRGLVTSSRRALLSAYDHHNCLLLEAELPEANLANSGSEIPHNAELSLVAENIHRITFSALSGHLTLSDFSFGA